MPGVSTGNGAHRPDAVCLIRIKSLPHGTPPCHVLIQQYLAGQVHLIDREKEHQSNECSFVLRHRDEILITASRSLVPVGSVQLEIQVAQHNLN